MICDEVQNFLSGGIKDDYSTPRRQTYNDFANFSNRLPNGPEIDEKKASNIAREEDQELTAGPNSLEEELQMRDLKIEGE